MAAFDVHDQPDSELDFNESFSTKAHQDNSKIVPLFSNWQSWGSEMSVFSIWDSNTVHFSDTTNLTATKVPFVIQQTKSDGIKTYNHLLKDLNAEGDK